MWSRQCGDLLCDLVPFSFSVYIKMDGALMVLSAVTPDVATESEILRTRESYMISHDELGFGSLAF